MFVYLPAPFRGHGSHVVLDQIDAVLHDEDRGNHCVVVMRSGQRYRAGIYPSDMISQIEAARRAAEPVVLQEAPMYSDDIAFVEFAAIDGRRYSLRPEQVRGFSGDDKGSEVYVTIGEVRRTVQTPLVYDVLRARMELIARIVQGESLP